MWAGLQEGKRKEWKAEWVRPREGFRPETGEEAYGEARDCHQHEEGKGKKKRKKIKGKMEK